MPNRAFKDTAGTTGYQSLGINLHLPLFGNRNKVKENILQGGTPHFYQTSLQAGFESLYSNIGFLQNQHNFYTASAGLGAILYNGKKNIIAMKARLGIASDGLTIKNNEIRYRVTGSFIVNHLQSATLMYQYGLVLTYAYGTSLPLPVLGLRKKFSTHWSFSAILPVSLQLKDKMNENMGFSIFIKPSGNRFQFQNQSNFNTASTSVFMGQRQLELGSSYYYKFCKQFSLLAEASLLGKGKMKFTEMNSSKTLLYQTGIKPGGKFRITLRYAFPHKKKIDKDVELDREL